MSSQNMFVGVDGNRYQTHLSKSRSRELARGHEEPVYLPEELREQYALDSGQMRINVQHDKQTVCRDIFSQYVSQQKQNKQNGNIKKIKVLNCGYRTECVSEGRVHVLNCEPKRAISMKTGGEVVSVLHSVREILAITDLAKYGVVEHATVSSVEEAEAHITSAGSQVETIVIRGVGMYSGKASTSAFALKKRDAFRLKGGFWAVFNWLFSLLNYFFESESRPIALVPKELKAQANSALKTIILQNTCMFQDTGFTRRGDLYIKQNRQMISMALDLARRYPGVAVTTSIVSQRDVQSCSTNKWFYTSDGYERRVYDRELQGDLKHYRYARAEDGRLGVSIQTNGREVSHTFCVDPNKDYCSMDALKLAADRLEADPDSDVRRAEFKHLVEHTQLGGQKVSQFFDYCKNLNKRHCVSALLKTHWYEVHDGKRYFGRYWS